MGSAQFIPVTHLVYDLYQVTYWTSENPGARNLGHRFFAVTDEQHLGSWANEAAPARAGFMTWEVVRENVGRPQSRGGSALYESSLEHGRRVALSLGL
jgi:hypothetical protein